MWGGIGEGGGGGGAKYARDRRLLQSYTVRGSQLTPGRSYWELLLRALTGKGTGADCIFMDTLHHDVAVKPALRATPDRKTLEWLGSQQAKISNTICSTWLEDNRSGKFPFRWTLLLIHLTYLISFAQDRSSLFMALNSQRSCFERVRSGIAKGFRLTDNHDRKSSATQILSPSSCSYSLFMVLKSQRTCLDFVARTGPLRNSKKFSTEW